MSTRRLLALLIFGGIAVAIGLSVLQLTTAGGGIKTLEKKRPPSCAESIQELGLQNEVVHCEDLWPGPTTEEPRLHGPYRIVPAGWEGTLTAQRIPYSGPQGVETTDLNLLRQSSLFAEPTYLPEGYRLVRGDTGEHNPSEVLVRLTYNGPSGEFYIARWRVPVDPIDIYAPPPFARSQLTATTINGTPAIIITPKPGQPYGTTSVKFVKDGVQTIIDGADLPADEVIRIAQSFR